jgi:excisionase family DNA binding protein
MQPMKAHEGVPTHGRCEGESPGDPQQAAGPATNLPNRPEHPVPGVPVRLLTAAQTAQMLGCHRSTLYRRVEAGEVPAPVKLGNSTRWRSDEIAALIERLSAARQANPPTAP